MPGRERTKSLSLTHGTLVKGQGPILGVETASESSIGGGELLNAVGCSLIDVTCSEQTGAFHRARKSAPGGIR